VSAIKNLSKADNLSVGRGAWRRNDKFHIKCQRLNESVVKINDRLKR